ncbi:GNAT family N-acetyltransferase [Pareuzebyella sediminis]|uniref:GNAT family N-acetyltransferase n=1 Tax=Pareuzebyella sediminis TaxID=2607998 RepID=UPI0011EDFD65|nr:GNAT family N-acetyltransferase [Pareuzebyella sediminis]
MEFDKKYRFFFDLFMRGTVSPFYANRVGNVLTDEVVFSSEETPLAFENVKISTVWDVPEYLEVSLKERPEQVRVSKIRQYKGYLIDLSKFKKVEDYLTDQLSSRNRKKLRSKKRKLESECSIRYVFYHGQIEKDEYQRLFSELYDMLDNRFEEKKTANHNLPNWQYYRDLVYPMILKKRASLFVIYDQEKPITIALQFHLKQTVFSYIQSYHIDYSQYNMGDICMLKRLEWCFEQDYRVLDLSMGVTDYKIKWCNHHYDLYFHVFYKANSISTLFKAKIQCEKLRFKQYLRDRNILGKLVRYDKIKYRIGQLRG